MKFRIIIFFLFLTGSVRAQKSDLSFNLVKGINGITLGRINAMTRDIHGTLWLSDQTYRCIVSFDGKRMTKYQNDPKNPNSLGGYYPECIFADSAGMIWIGFYGMGLDRLDPETGNFTHYRYNRSDPNSLANDTITSILVDHIGKIWVGTYSGIDLLDANTGKFTHYKHSSTDPSSLSHNKVRALFEDRQGEIWVGTGLVWDYDTLGGLNRLDRSTGKFTRYLHDPQNPHSLIDNRIRAIFEDSKGNFWVGTAGDGLHSLDRKTGQFQRYPYDPKQPDRLSRPPLYDGPRLAVSGKPIKIEDHITFINEDADGQLWIGTFLNGTNRYDPKAGVMKHYGSPGPSENNIEENNPWCSVMSPDGLVWIGTQDATLYMADINAIKIPFHRLNLPLINDVEKESATVSWYGTDNGLYRIDTASKKTERFFYSPGHENKMSQYINEINSDKEGFLWISTINGLNRFDRKTNTLTSYLFQPGAEDFSPSTTSFSNTYEDSKGNLWAGTWGKGLARLDRKTGQFTWYKNNPADTNSLSQDLVVFEREDISGDLWVGAYNNGGLNRLNVKTGKFRHYLPDINIIASLVDAAGVLWMGTSSGLFHYDRKKDTFIPLENSNSSFTIPFIRSMTTDEEDNLWMATSSGIYRLNKARDRLLYLGTRNGVIGDSLYYGTTNRETDGKINFTATYGYYEILPKNIRINIVPPNIQITSFFLDGKLVQPGENGPLKKPMFKADEIQVGHDQNSFSIGFSDVDFSNFEDKKIYYKLANYDKDWRIADPDNKAYYYNVSPGNYIFHVKTFNGNNGIWAEKTIAIIISPPWWTTWWAYSLYVLIFLFLGWSIYKIQKERLIKAEQEKNRAKELAQAKEIEKAYQVLKTTQSQLIQSEKMASLGELTAGIAHEIQNPLNFVNNFSEVSTELIDEMNTEIEKGNVDEVKNISGHIKQNLEKIMHHGKRADAIVKGMLQHSQMGSGQKELTDINALTDEYFRLAYHGLRAKDKAFNATMKSDFDNKVGNINVIPQDIGRVIINLITNAFYAVNEKNRGQNNGYVPTVSVSTKLLDMPNGKTLSSGPANHKSVIISVKDNGNGIPLKVLDKIFQPFFTTKPTGQGTGLGLSLSYDIVKAHGGELKVQTKEGEGSEFVIQLPV